MQRRTRFSFSPTSRFRGLIGRRQASSAGNLNHHELVDPEALGVEQGIDAFSAGAYVSIQKSELPVMSPESQSQDDFPQSLNSYHSDHVLSPRATMTPHNSISQPLNGIMPQDTAAQFSVARTGSHTRSIPGQIPSNFDPRTIADNAGSNRGFNSSTIFATEAKEKLVPVSPHIFRVSSNRQNPQELLHMATMPDSSGSKPSSRSTPISGPPFVSEFHMSRPSSPYAIPPEQSCPVADRVYKNIIVKKYMFPETDGQERAETFQIVADRLNKTFGTGPHLSAAVKTELRDSGKEWRNELVAGIASIVLPVLHLDDYADLKSRRQAAKSLADGLTFLYKTLAFNSTGEILNSRYGRPLRDHPLEHDCIKKAVAYLITHRPFSGKKKLVYYPSEVNDMVATEPVAFACVAIRYALDVEAERPEPGSSFIKAELDHNEYERHYKNYVKYLDEHFKVSPKSLENLQHSVKEELLCQSDVELVFESNLVLRNLSENDNLELQEWLSENRGRGRLS